MGIENREFARFNFTPGMWVKILRVGNRPSDYKMYQLLDVSQSGISFKVHKVDEFKAGDEFYILEVESLLLENPIKGIARYVMALDQFGVDWKVGVEFLKRL